MRPDGSLILDVNDTALFDQVLARGNLKRAWEHVRANKGGPGIDGIDIEAFPERTRALWPSILASLRNGTYRPSAARRVEIPKVGGGRRLLGIPTVLDRVIQQALAQVLVPIFDPGFSEHSYAYRPGRSAQDAARTVHTGICAGRSWAVDIDLSKFFDRVDHDLLMARVARKVRDKRVLRLIGRMLRSGVVIDGVFHTTGEGVPQGAPLSPLLANIMLDDLDHELARRGHCFARYADDFVILVRSRLAGERVMSSVRRFVERTLKLVVNETKSAVIPSRELSYLGFGFARRKIRWTKQTVDDFKYAVRQITGRNRGISLACRMRELNVYLRGWMGYYRHATYWTPLQALDSWIRNRLRMCLWRQWRYVRTRISNLISMGAPRREAIAAGCSNKGCCRLSRTYASKAAMNNAWFDTLGLYSLERAWTSFHYPQG